MSDLDPEIVKFVQDHNENDPLAITIVFPKQARDLLRHQFLKKLDGVVDYWDKLPGKTTRERIEGAVATVLSELDGGNIDLPPFNITSCTNFAFTHNGTKVIIPADTEICDGALHSQFVNREALLRNIDEVIAGLAED